MSFLLKESFHRSVAETLYYDILSRRGSYYYFIGRPIAWGNEAVPDTPSATRVYEYDTRNNIIGVKKISISDVALVTRRIDWVTSTVYDQFDGDYNSVYPSDTGATDIKDADFYVLTSAYNVYKCLFNNNGGFSTVQPSGTDLVPVTYGDGYVWKYMYSIPLALRNRFLTSNHMPVVKAITNNFYSNGAITSIVIDSGGSGYTNANTIITVTGDGVNANLQPFVNGSGQLQDIVIINSGSGYTYADVAVSVVAGAGAGANAYVDFSTGDLNTQQAFVELSAINGALYGFRVNNAGNNYTSATVSVEGDGINFVGNVVLNSNTNTISKVTVTNPGSKFTFANVAISGNGSNANLTAIISPVGGHGFNPINELFADTIMLYSTINNERNQGITVNNDFRQTGVLKDITDYTNNLKYANTQGSSCFLVTMGSVGSLARDGRLTLATGNITRSFEIVEVISATNQLLLADKHNYTPAADITLTDPNTNITYTIVSVDKKPTINKFSGDLLFIDNRTSVSYSDQQLVTLRTVIKL